MSALLRGIARIGSSPAVRGSSLIQRAKISSKPAKDTVGPVQSVISLGMFALAILAPSGWVLANIESYKKRE